MLGAIVPRRECRRLDIAIEEFSHLEMISKLVAQHTHKIAGAPVYDRAAVQGERRRSALP
jgi:Mn-containing catalase